MACQREFSSRRSFTSEWTDIIQCCNPEINGGGGWGIFNALFGWQNSATYGTVISYNLYWIVIIVIFFLMRYKENRGHWPFLKAKTVEPDEKKNDLSSDEERSIDNEKKAASPGVLTEVRSVES